MANMEEIITEHQEKIQAFQPATAKELEAFRIRYLGSKGLLKEIFSQMKTLSPEQKKEMGKKVNAFKQLAEESYAHFRTRFAENGGAEAPGPDLSLPGLPLARGSRHPLATMEREIVGLFRQWGFEVAEGPEIEDDWHNFSSLNIPADHPARDMQDTFYLSRNPDWVLRTHTSSVQARSLEKGRLPLRIICPGRVYRNESISARAHCFFHQIEGLYVDQKVSFADLKQVLYLFARSLFGEAVRIRFRPSYFPFTEPSAEMDISCTLCQGEGCTLCKHTGWVEILGCGMVHPRMLAHFGIDSDQYTGYAFGMGVERMTQIRYQINDLRLYSQNDLRFLQQFESIP